MADITVTVNIDDATIERRLREWGYTVRDGKVWFGMLEWGDMRTAFTGILQARVWQLVGDAESGVPE